MVAQCPDVVQVESRVPRESSVVCLVVQITHIDVHNLLPGKVLLDGIHVVNHFFCCKVDVAIVMYTISGSLTYKRLKFSGAS
eukprot:5790654-Amphidinium_carterae.3